MAILDSVMARLGYVRLGRYGLALTPQGRIISTQPSILDDGSGGRVVGWQRGDLAELSLATLPVGRAPAPPAEIPAPPIKTFAHTVPVTPVARVVVPPPTPAPVQVAKLALQGIAQFSAPAVPPAPVIDDEDEDDDWDWQMAVARARASAEETEAVVVAKPKIAAPVIVKPAPLTAPTGVKVSPPPMPTRAPKMSAPVIRDSSMVPSRMPAKMTSTTKTNVVPMRAATPPAPLPPRRAARGTGQVGEDPATAKIAIAPPAAQAQRPMPLPPPTEDTAIRARAAVAAAAAPRRPLAPQLDVTRIEAMPVEDTHVDTRTEIKPAPLPRFSTRFAAAR